MEKIVRDLKISEFNRTLSLLSKAIEIEKQMAELGGQQTQLDHEIVQWESMPNTRELEETIKVNRTKLREINQKKQELGNYQAELKRLAAHILEVVFDGGFCLKKDDLKVEFLREYIYLLTEIEQLNDELFAVGDVFYEKADLLLLLYDQYGREQEELIYEIANMESTEILMERFTEYFKL